MACCEQLRQEVKMLKDQQDKMFNKLAQQESMDKKGLMTSIGALVETLANKFPDLKENLKKIKTMLDSSQRASQS